MSLAADIARAVFQQAGEVFRQRRKRPCETRDRFRRRAAFWELRGRKRFARTASKRAEFWDRLCQERGGCDAKA